MKYPWLNKNGIEDSRSMETSGDFIEREYHIKVLDQQEQHHCTKKAKRFRSAFTTDQVKYLEKQFKKFPYIGNAHRKEVAVALNIPERAVKIWFQNRRMKEKKEASNKEFDDEHGIRKSLELAKDQLNNVSVPSANEQSRSLPLITDRSQRMCDKNMITNNTPYNMSRPLLQDSGAKLAYLPGPPTVPNVVTTAKVVHPPHVMVKTSSPSNYQTSGDFSINLCKKYKSEIYANINHAQTTVKKEVEDANNSVKPTSISPVEQILPEDLSPNRKIHFPTMIPQQNVPGTASNNSGYVSLVPTVSPFYTQPYLSASGVIWKPMSVMPIVPSSSSPMSAPNNPLSNMSPVQENILKTSCSCDCHVKQIIPQVPYTFPQQSPSPQYIITAVPFQNPSTKY